jgi:pimeloyl-ACP methyl ester carboxylesterase
MPDLASYTGMRQRFGDLFQSGQYAEAASILEWGLERFPANLYANAYNLALCRVMLGQSAGAVDALTYALDRGVWFSQWAFVNEAWEPLRQLESFQQIRDRSAQCRQAAQEKSRPELTIVPPEGYDPAKKYPLFLALHGGDETVARFRPRWTSPRMASEFIVVYPQSSRVVSMQGFYWIGDRQDREEILSAYQTALASYSVDTARVIVGGFSSGGHMTLTLLLDEQELLPVRGFIVLCPPVPEAYPRDAVARIRSRGQKGVFLTTEMDGRIEDQRKLAAAFAAEGLAFQFIVTPNVGHWYPPDLAQRIDEAIAFILA